MKHILFINNEEITVLPDTVHGCGNVHLWRYIYDDSLSKEYSFRTKNNNYIITREEIVSKIEELSLNARKHKCNLQKIVAQALTFYCHLLAKLPDHDIDQFYIDFLDSSPYEIKKLDENYREEHHINLTDEEYQTCDEKISNLYHEYMEERTKNDTLMVRIELR